VLRAALLLACSVAVAVAAGCGYGLVRYAGGFGEVRSVAVDTPRNDSSEPGAELVVADALRREILRRRAPRLVSAPERADLVLSGRVLPVEVRGGAFSSVVMALEYELTLEIELHARRADGSEVALDRRALRETERFLASADVEAARKNRQEALRQAAALLAGRVYDALQETLVP
jgi:hypothetical protein